MQQPSMGMQQLNMGMQQPNMGMQQLNMGMQQPSMGMQQLNMEMQLPIMGMQQPNIGMHQDVGQPGMEIYESNTDYQGSDMQYSSKSDRQGEVQHVFFIFLLNGQTPFIEWHVRFTTVLLKALSNQ